jgi:hypothetical protein
VIQDLNDGSIDATSTMLNFANDVYGPSPSMVSLLNQEGYSTATMPYLNMYDSSSTICAPYIQGGYTNLLLGVDRAAAFQPPVKKLNFDGVPDQDGVPHQDDM